MVVGLQDFLLEGAVLVTFISKVPSFRCFFRAQLKKQDQIRLWESNVGLFAPVQAEVLSQTKTSEFEVKGM